MRIDGMSEIRSFFHVRTQIFTEALGGDIRQFEMSNAFYSYTYGLRTLVKGVLIYFVE